MADALRAFVASTGTDADWAGAILVSEYLHDMAQLKGHVEGLIKALSKSKSKGRRR